MQGEEAVAEKRDFIDDLIDIQQDWAKVSNPLGNLTSTLAADPGSIKAFDPSEYKERPRANSIFCLRVASNGNSDRAERTCSRCLDICPVDAIEIHGSSVKISDDCRKCGLCTMVCPTEVFVAQKLMAKSLYDKIVRVASSHEQCYVTCTRALGRVPRDNEVVLPCVGTMPKELWFSLIADYDNISVYLPLGICDRCRTTTGEEAYAEQISCAEEWSQRSVGLEVDERDLNHEQSRAYKRGQFMGNMARAGQAAFAATNPALAGAQAIAKKIQAHSTQVYEMQRALERAVGDKTSGNHRRILTQKRKSVLTMLQGHPALAGRMRLETPVCDLTRCTMCGDCVKACPVHACELDPHGHFQVEPAYCLNCGACVTICPEDALRMRLCDPSELVVRDEEAERRKREVERQRAQVRRAKEAGKKQLGRALDAIERLGED